MKSESSPSGDFTRLDGEDVFRIRGVDRLSPFLMNIASDCDLWMFLTSRGGLTAGRVDPDGALFPYETVDRLHDGHHHTGPITWIRARRGDGPDRLWQPLAAEPGSGARVERNLYKNVLGNRVVFEEIHTGLELAFRYDWSASDELGWVRTVRLENLGADPVGVECLDGVRNVLPFGAPLALYQQSSSLVDAYKRTDFQPDAGLAIFSLTARIIDRAEPAEELRANTVWRCGGNFRVCLSRDAIGEFRAGRAPAAERRLNGHRGNYLAISSLELEPGEHATWHVGLDAGRDHVQVAARRAWLLAGGDRGADIRRALDQATENLTLNVASSDALQLTSHAETCAHHLANVLYNNMRGGVFVENHVVPAADFADFVATRSRTVAARHRDRLEGLPGRLPVDGLLAAAEETGDADLQRLAYEYLPLHFGRRHGDPSRPWNRFTIRVRDPDGSRALRYEGNWRDIFQNWEALAASFPRFLPGMIAKFVNASTVDGFNPYRITRDGVDWEVEDRRDPWSYIGYWGDHQIVYLLRLLEAQERVAPGVLDRLLGREIFAYADVPYRLKPYEDIRRDPRATIEFDVRRDAAIREREKSAGTDARLVTETDGSVYHVTLLEKLLVSALAKLSNLVPGSGIWMNTQRPEWNDANNALVGNGVSVVTLAYLRRYLHFVARMIERAESEELPVSVEVGTWLGRVHGILARHRPRFVTTDGRQRAKILDALGAAFCEYRSSVYRHGLTAKRPLALAVVAAFCRDALEVADDAIRANRRADGLYHSYHLLVRDAQHADVSVQQLPEMLEGQVAALSSGVVAPIEATQLLSALFGSRLYRADQRSFLLYPARELPAFDEKNVIPDERIEAVPLLRDLLAAGDTSIVARDVFGVAHFHGDFANAGDVSRALDELAGSSPWTEAVSAQRDAVLDVFEAVFDHRSFTGRSGTMYGYEGLGCIYWHMVAKLLLAVQELARQARQDGTEASVLEALVDHYYRIRAGLGFEKSVVEYGAFPTDPYSHTPPDGGARQPGMTGQVKEEILARFGELGVEIADGIVAFRPWLLRPSEFRSGEGQYEYIDLAGSPRTMRVPIGALAFSYAQVPVLYRMVDGAGRIHVTWADGREEGREGDALDAAESRSLLDRDGAIARIEVAVPAGALGPPR